MAWKRCTSSGAWGRNSEKEEAVAPAKTKTAPGMGRGLPSRVYSPSCMGGQEILQPAPGDPAQLGVKLVEEDQGDQPVFIAQSLMEGVEELGTESYWDRFREVMRNLPRLRAICLTPKDLPEPGGPKTAMEIGLGRPPLRPGGHMHRCTRPAGS